MADVKIGRRLVEEENGCILSQQNGQPGPLLFTAGKVLHGPFFIALKADGVDGTMMAADLLSSAATEGVGTETAPWRLTRRPARLEEDRETGSKRRFPATRLSAKRNGRRGRKRSIAPPEIGIMQFMALRKVLLPQPLGPTMAVILPLEGTPSYREGWSCRLVRRRDL